MRSLMVLLAFAVAQPAFGLSCRAPDPVRDFQQAQASDDVFVVVEGRLKFDARRLPSDKLDPNDKPARTDIPARLSGASLGPKGFGKAFNENITLRVRCFSAWCGSATNGMDYVAFLKRENGGYVMQVDPCGSMAYSKPNKALKATLTKCFNGRCAPKR